MTNALHGVIVIANGRTAAAVRPFLVSRGYRDGEEASDEADQGRPEASDEARMGRQEGLLIMSGIQRSFEIFVLEWAMKIITRHMSETNDAGVLNATHEALPALSRIRWSSEYLDPAKYGWGGKKGAC